MKKKIPAGGFVKIKEVSRKYIYIVSRYAALTPPQGVKYVYGEKIYANSLPLVLIN